MDDRDTADSLLREVAAAPSVALSADVSALLIEPGDVIDGTFQIEERLGAGGMGVVYAARDLTLGREVALKFMRFDRAAAEAGARLTEAFEREARATARLNHPNVVTLYQIGRWKGGIYLVLERLRGETLAARLERGTLTASEATAIGIQILVALVHVHGMGIAHRDLKPHNIFLVGGNHVKILDFGVSGLVRAVEAVLPPGEERRSTLAHAGTPGYMAPEQWSGGRVDARADVWAVGAIMFQLVTGKLPFGSGSLAGDEPSPAAPVRASDPALAAVIEGCLAPRAADRPAAAEIVAALRRLRHDPIELAAARVKPARRRRTLAALVLVGTAAAMGTAMITGGDARRCELDNRARALWNAAARQRLAARFGVDASVVARAIFVDVARDLDAYVTEWEALARTACEIPAIRACLDDRYESLARTLTVLDHLDASHAEAALPLAGHLPRVRDCSDAGVAEVVVTSANVVRDAGGPFKSVLRISGHHQDNVHDIVEMPDGDVVLAAYTSVTARIAGRYVVDKLTTNRNGVLLRLRPDHSVAWSFDPEARMVAVERLPSGDLAIAGTVAKSSPFGGAARATSGWTCFVAVVDGQRGTLRWARRCDTTGNGFFMSLAVDAAGNIYAGGQFGGELRIGDRVFDARTNREGVPVVGSWTSDGGLRWVTAGAETADARTQGLTYADGILVASARVYGAGQFGGRRLHGGCVIARLDPDSGDVRWLVETNGAAARCEVYDVATGGGRLFAAGSIDNSAWIDELSVADGTQRWRSTFGTGETRIRALGLLPDGRIAAGGYLADTGLVIDSVRLANFGGTDAFVVIFDRDGTAIRGLGFGGTSADRIRSLHVGPSGRLWVGGRFQLGMTLGARELRTGIYADAFLIELAPELQ